MPEASAHCVGAAYRVEVDAHEEVIETLDVREQGGYERIEVRLELREPVHVVETGIVYLATPGNPNYLGPARVDEMVAQIRDSHGPSGPNTEYVLRLAEALRELGAHDHPVVELEAALRRELAD